MRKLLNRTSIVFVALAVLAVSLLLFSRGGDSASASHGTTGTFPPVPFATVYNVNLGEGFAFPGDVPGFGQTGAVGAPTDVTQFASQGVFDPGGVFPPLFTPRFGGNIPSSGIIFTPADWTVVPGAALPNGAVVGGSFTATTLALTNGPCLGTAPVPSPLIDANTDSTKKIVTGINFANLIVDDFDPAPHVGAQVGSPTAGDDPLVDAPHGDINFIPDGADYYPDLLEFAIPPTGPNGVGDPFQRSYIQLPNFLNTGTNVVADVVTYAPDQLAPLGVPLGLGYATVVIIENFSPFEPPNPSPITDQCGFETSLLSPAGTRFNPPTPGTKVFYALSQSRIDADNDGFDNDADRCPYNPADTPFNLDTFGPFPSFFFATFPLDSDQNGIPNSCDPGTPPLAAGLDGDLDAFPNAQDNCPQVSNFPQVESEAAVLAVPVPTGPSSDSIGDLCDHNPFVPDGHGHQDLVLDYVCIGLTDGDGDGVCDDDEDSLGSDKTDISSTPENLSITGTCDDLVDNDGDGDIDLGIGTGTAADSDCELADHDIAIKKVTGAREICGPGETDSAKGGYVIQLRNNTGAAETAEIGITLAPVDGTLDHDLSTPAVIDPPKTNQATVRPEVTSVTGATVTSSRPVNVDGDLDVEWETKATVDLGATGITVVGFRVTYANPCAAGPDSTPVDYTISVDVCHGDDIPPLALFGETSPRTCGATADGGQDRVSTGNDGPVDVLVNDVSR